MWRQHSLNCAEVSVFYCKKSLYLGKYSNFLRSSNMMGCSKDFFVLLNLLRNYSVSKQKKEVADDDKMLNVTGIICGVVN